MTTQVTVTPIWKFKRHKKGHPHRSDDLQLTLGDMRYLFFSLSNLYTSGISESSCIDTFKSLISPLATS